MVCGPGSLATLEAELAQLGLCRPLLVSGPHVAGAGLTSRILHRLTRPVAGVFSGSQPNTPAAVVRELTELARDTLADVLISIGGGSAHDAAKAAAILLGEGGELRDHASAFHPPDTLDTPALRSPRLPIVTVSTTFSGAEMTGSAGFTEDGVKFVLVDPRIAPRLVILDAELAASTPARVLAGSGFNALDHCVEAVLSRGHQPIADALALAGIAILYRRLESAVRGDLSAITDCQLGTYMSAVSYQNTGLGINHAVCHVLGAAGIGHGDAHAILLPHGIRFNESAAADRINLLSDTLSVQHRGLAQSLAELAAHLGLPSQLRQLRIAREDLVGLAERVMMDRHLRTNPRRVESASEVAELLDAAW